MVADVEEVIHIGEGVELIERVLNALHIYALHRVVRIALAGVCRDAVGDRIAVASVGNDIGQRVVLDHQHEANVRGSGGQDVVYGVDVIVLVLLEAGARQRRGVALGSIVAGDAQLAVGGQGGAVAIGQIVNHELDDDGISVGLRYGRVDVCLEPRRPLLTEPPYMAPMRSNQTKVGVFPTVAICDA